MTTLELIYFRALEEIKNTQGKVCKDFDICTHDSCMSSYSSWAIAEKALTATGYARAERGE